MTINANWRATGFASALYLLVGIQLPYLPVWLESSRGLSGAAITGVISLATLIRIFAGPLIAGEAERSGLRRMLGVMALVLAASYVLAVPADAIFFVMAAATLSYVAWGVMPPLNEALLVAATREGRPDYGVARAIASFAFIVASFGGGLIVSTYGADPVIFMLIGFALLLALMSLPLAPRPKDRPPPLSLKETMKQGFALFGRRRIVFATLAVSFIQAAHAYYYSLGSNVWKNMEIDESHIGALWSTGVAVEVLLLLVSGWLFARWSPGAILLLGGLGAVVRWTLAGFAPSLEIIYILQGLHALTFAATHIGGLRFLAAEIPNEKIGVVMTITSAMVFGPLMAGLGVVGGQFYDAVTPGAAQAQGYWIMAGAALVGVLCTLPILRSAQPQSAAEGGETIPPV